MVSREKLTRGFLWLSILGGGIGLGAKLFDLIIVAGAWGANPPDSLRLMPYGPNYALDPGDFFIPLSAILVVGIFGAAISGWKSLIGYRVWLVLPVLSLIITWILTPTVFWPMISDLWYTGTGKIVMTHDESTALVRRWMIWDWGRVVLIAASFFSSIRAISIPYPK